MSPGRFDPQQERSGHTDAVLRVSVLILFGGLTDQGTYSAGTERLCTKYAVTLALYA